MIKNYINFNSFICYDEYLVYRKVILEGSSETRVSSLNQTSKLQRYLKLYSKNIVLLPDQCS